MTDYTGLTDGTLLALVERHENLVAAHAAEARAAKDEYLHRKRNQIAAAYGVKGDAFGLVRLDDSGFEVEITTPQKVDWDQDALAALQAEIRDGWKADPGEFIDAKLSVKESKYKAWPSDLKARFEPARTVRPGTPSLKISRKA